MGDGYLLCVCIANVSQIIAIGTALPAANQRCRLAKQLAMIDTITRFITLVAKAGLSFPKTVGSIAGMKAS